MKDTFYLDCKESWLQESYRVSNCIGFTHRKVFLPWELSLLQRIHQPEGFPRLVPLTVTLEFSPQYFCCVDICREVLIKYFWGDTERLSSTRESFR